jgi:hypothetical protein
VRGKWDRPDEVATKSFRVTVVDRTAPRLVMPETMRARTANKKGAVVGFEVSASDLVDRTIVPACSPASSTLFRIGTTRIDCRRPIAGRTSPAPRSRRQPARSFRRPRSAPGGACRGPRRLRRYRARPVRQAGRPEHVPRTIKKPRSRRAFGGNQFGGDLLSRSAKSLAGGFGQLLRPLR